MWISSVLLVSGDPVAISRVIPLVHSAFDAVGNDLWFLVFLGIFISLWSATFENQAEPLDGQRVVNLLPQSWNAYLCTRVAEA